MNRAPIVLLALVGLLVAAPVIGVADAQQAGNETAGNEPSNATTSDDSGLTLKELRETGPRQANSPPSVRMGSDQFFWMVYWPASNPFADVGATDGGEYLPPSVAPTSANGLLAGQ